MASFFPQEHTCAKKQAEDETDRFAASFLADTEKTVTDSSCPGPAKASQTYEPTWIFLVFIKR
jgi:hypothetical protein